MRDAGERAQRLGDRVVLDPECARDGGRSGCVLAIVSAGDQRLRRERIVGGELDSVEAGAARHDLRAGTLEDAELGIAVRLEAAVTVEVIRLEVQQAAQRRT